MLSRVIVMVVTLAAAVTAASVGEEATAVAAAESNRDSKFLPVMQIITFENGPCEASSGEHGTCYSQKECDGLAGAASGTCANGFGVCCVLQVTCDGWVNKNGSYFVNHAYPASTSTPGMCMVEITPPTGTCQILLEFEDFDMVGPLEGDCTNDTFVVLGANQGSNIPTLCGINTGQHMYIDIDNSDGPFKLVSTMSAFNYMRRWKIKVTFIDEKHPCKTPFRCLQYFTEPTGAFSSFNFGGSPSQMLNGQMYSICFGYVPGYCDIGINYNRYDLGNINGDCGNDYTANAGDKLCGDFVTTTSQLNATGPISLTVFTDDNNEREEEGFSAAYMMMAC